MHARFPPTSRPKGDGVLQVVIADIPAPVVPLRLGNLVDARRQPERMVAARLRPRAFVTVQEVVDRRGRETGSRGCGVLPWNSPLEVQAGSDCNCCVRVQGSRLSDGRADSVKAVRARLGLPRRDPATAGNPARLVAARSSQATAPRCRAHSSARRWQASTAAAASPLRSSNRPPGAGTARARPSARLVASIAANAWSRSCQRRHLVAPGRQRVGVEGIPVRQEAARAGGANTSSPLACAAGPRARPSRNETTPSSTWPWRGTPGCPRRCRAVISLGDQRFGARHVAAVEPVPCREGQRERQRERVLQAARERHRAGARRKRRAASPRSQQIHDR